MSEEEKIDEKVILREFKSQVFDSFWERFGTFFVHILPHPSLEIGKRGLLAEEKESGIVLVFGPKAVRDISSQAQYLYAELQFGYAWEKLIIPWDAVFRMYDKAQIAVVQTKVFSEEIDWDKKGANSGKSVKKSVSKKIETESNVIKVDFGVKK